MKTKQAAHTPTPWGFEPIRYDAYTAAIRTLDPLTKEVNAGSSTVAHLAGMSGVAELNAEFIVRAVNSHEALLEAATEALFALGRTGANSDLKSDGRPAWEKLREAINLATDGGK